MAFCGQGYPLIEKIWRRFSLGVFRQCYGKLLFVAQRGVERVQWKRFSLSWKDSDKMPKFTNLYFTLTQAISVKCHPSSQ